MDALFPGRDMGLVGVHEILKVVSNQHSEHTAPRGNTPIEELDAIGKRLLDASTLQEALGSP